MRAWLPWIYQYGVGGVVFVVSLLLAHRAGAYDRSRYSHRATVIALCGALLVFMMVHALWIARVTR